MIINFTFIVNHVWRLNGAGSQSAAGSSASALASSTPWVSKSSLVADKPAIPRGAPPEPLASASSQPAEGKPATGQNRAAAAAATTAVASTVPSTAAARRLNLPSSGGLVRRGGYQSPLPALASASLPQRTAAEAGPLSTDARPTADRHSSHADFIALSPSGSLEAPSPHAPRWVSPTTSFSAGTSSGGALGGAPQSAVGRFEAYLEGLSGPFADCQKAAITAAEQVRRKWYSFPGHDLPVLYRSIYTLMGTIRWSASSSSLVL